MKELGDISGEGMEDFKAVKVYHESQLKIANELGDRSGDGVASRNRRNTSQYLLFLMLLFCFCFVFVVIFYLEIPQYNVFDVVGCVFVFLFSMCSVNLLCSWI